MVHALRCSALLVLFTLPGAFLAGCGGSPPEPGPVAEKAAGPATMHPAEGTAAMPRAEPNQVVIDNFAFRPAKLTIAAGTKVTWVNRDDVPHTATSTQKSRSF